MNNAHPWVLRDLMAACANCEDLLRTEIFKKCSCLASLLVISYDNLLIFDEELRQIWLARWSMVKALYIFVRLFSYAMIVDIYFAFSPSVTDRVIVSIIIPANEPATITSASFYLYRCTIYIRWQQWAGLIVFFSTASILSLRIYAMYNRSRRVAMAFFATFFVCIVCIITFFIMGNHKNISHASQIPGHNFCVVQDSFMRIFWTWAPFLMFYEGLLLLFAVYKGIQAIRENPCFRLTREFALGMLVQDSVLYFAAGFTAMMANVLVWSLAPAYKDEISVDFYVALVTPTSLRMLLNIREKFNPSELTDELSSISFI